MAGFLETDRMALRLDDRAVQEADKRVMDRAKLEGGRDIGLVGAGLAKYAYEDKKSEAELEIEKQGVVGLQNAFKTIGLNIDATAFRNDLNSGWDLYESESKSIRGKKEKEKNAKAMTGIISQGRTKTTPIYGIQEEDVDVEALNEMAMMAGDAGFDATRLKPALTKVKTGETVEELTMQDAVEQYVKSGGDISGLNKADYDFLGKFFGVQEDQDLGDMSKDEADRRKAVIAAKEAEAKWNNISKGNLPINDEGRKGFKKQIETLALNAYKFKEQNAGLESMVDFFNQTPEEKFKTGAYDTALVFQFMKALDPASVVREGEFDTAAKSAGALEFVMNFVEKMKSGKFLGKTQRAEFMEIMTNVVDYRRKAVNGEIDSLQDRAPQLYYNKVDEATKAKVADVIKNTLPDINRISMIKRKKKKTNTAAPKGNNKKKPQGTKAPPM